MSKRSCIEEMIQDNSRRTGRTRKINDTQISPLQIWGKTRNLPLSQVQRAHQDETMPAWLMQERWSIQKRSIWEWTSKYALDTNSHLIQKLVNLMIFSAPWISALQATVSQMSLYLRFGRPRDAAARALSADTSHSSRGNLQKRFSSSWNDDCIPFCHMVSDKCIFTCNVYSLWIPIVVVT